MLITTSLLSHFRLKKNMRSSPTSTSFYFEREKNRSEQNSISELSPNQRTLEEGWSVRSNWMECHRWSRCQGNWIWRDNRETWLLANKWWCCDSNFFSVLKSSERRLLSSFRDQQKSEAFYIRGRFHQHLFARTRWEAIFGKRRLANGAQIWQTEHKYGEF